MYLFVLPTCLGSESITKDSCKIWSVSFKSPKVPSSHRGSWTIDGWDSYKILYDYFLMLHSISTAHFFFEWLILVVKCNIKKTRSILRFISMFNRLGLGSFSQIRLRLVLDLLPNKIFSTIIRWILRKRQVLFWNVLSVSSRGLFYRYFFLVNKSIAGVNFCYQFGFKIHHNYS